MTQILERLCRFEYITVVIFPEDVILNEPVDKWPLCDCLISFHSKGTAPKHTCCTLTLLAVFYVFHALFFTIYKWINLTLYILYSLCDCIGI